MTYADRLTGSALVVVFLPSGGTAPADNKTLTGDQTSFKPSRKLDTVDVSAGSETARAFKGTLESLDWNLMIFDANQSYKADILPGAEGKLSVYPEGIGTGLPYFEFNTLITGYDEDFPFDGALEIEVTGVRQGEMITEVGSVQA